MSYNYRTQQEQNWIKIKSALKNTVNTVKEQLYHLGLMQAPEVRINRNLPALPAQIQR